MKKTLAVLSLAIIGVAATAFVEPKTTMDNTAFEGIITYSIDVSEPQAAPMVGSTLTVYIKGDKLKKDKDGMFAQLEFDDANKPNKPIILINAMGSKYLVKIDTTKIDTATPQITYENDTKKIAGYVCNKAELKTTIQGEPFSTTIYYCADLVSHPIKTGPFKGLKGMPMEYTIPGPGFTMTFTATKVKKQDLTDDIFIAHTSGYKLMTMDEIRADMMQNSQNGN